MATVSDIDTVAAVNKFLSRPVVVSKDVVTSDQGDEIAAILESVAISFLLNPQVALTFILMAKNQLQQIVAKDIELLDYISKAVDDVQNPNISVSDLSNLVEAQTALVEIDRQGSFQADTQSFQRYNTAVNNFLDSQLAQSLKRRQTGELERTGTEARQDLYTALGLFLSTHGVMIQSLADLARSVDDFRSVDLTRIVSQKTVASVRASLQKVQQGFQRNSISNTSAAIELLSGAAALQSISSSQDIYSPLVKTGQFPVGRSISVSSELVAAFAINIPGPYDISSTTSRQIYVKIDEEGPAPFSAIIDGIAFPNQPTLIGAPFSGNTITLPGTLLRLYIACDDPTVPELNYDLSIYGTSVDVGTLQSDLNTALNPTINVLVNNRADGRSELVLVGAVTTTFVTVRDAGAGSVDVITGVFTPPDPSGHSYLGFTGNQTSDPLGIISRERLVDRLNAQAGTRLLAAQFEDVVKVTSLSTDTWSSVDFDPSTSAVFGFQTNDRQTAQTTALLLIEKGQQVDPASLGIYLGSQVTMQDNITSSRSGVFAVVSIDGNRLLFGSVDLPRGLEKPVTVLLPGVAGVQQVIQKTTPFVGTFDKDSQNIQQALSPLLSQQPTQAQTADAKKTIAAIRLRLTNTDQSGLSEVLAAVVVRDDQSAVAGTAKVILSALEERGLDRASGFLVSGEFSSFFDLEVEAASTGGNFLKSIEDVMTNNFQTTTIESDQQDIRPSGQAPDSTLSDVNPSGGIK